MVQVRPIVDAIRSGAWKTLLGTLVAGGVSFGVLNAHQATALTTIAATLVTLVTAVTSIVAQAHILTRAEPLVTPVAAPRDNAGQPLVPGSSPPPTLVP
jgi:hypothetical protein